MPGFPRPTFPSRSPIRVSQLISTRGTLLSAVKRSTQAGVCGRFQPPTAQRRSAGPTIRRIFVGNPRSGGGHASPALPQPSSRGMPRMAAASAGGWGALSRALKGQGAGPRVVSNPGREPNRPDGPERPAQVSATGLNNARAARARDRITAIRRAQPASHARAAAVPLTPIRVRIIRVRPIRARPIRVRPI